MFPFDDAIMDDKEGLKQPKVLLAVYLVTAVAQKSKVCILTGMQK